MVTTYTWDLFKDPFFIGFDRMVDNWSTVASTNYPPYNVIKHDEDNFTVEIALAGFNKSDIDVVVADGKLTVKGESAPEDEESQFIHRGIAARKFTREWALGEYMEVNSAELKDGMLKIKLERVLPEEKKPRQIKVK
jgi:molecular chaperone IbpA